MSDGSYTPELVVATNLLVTTPHKMVRKPTLTPVVDDEYPQLHDHWCGIIQSELHLSTARQLKLVAISYDCDGNDLTPIDAVSVCSRTRH